ncbi:unnamed protein product [Allacma fusca]|uniref:Uncharacterized protein n=1 Tax=Allacma fusca TaxID=39272 RepID=A0A8J2PNW6_9HEXA|nr:unnamed protein product [Allacma fusca]
MLLNILIFGVVFSRVSYFAQSEPLQFSALSEQDYGDNLRGLHGDQLANLIRVARNIRKRPDARAENAPLGKDQGGDYEGTFSITIAPCQREGIILIQGKARYFIKCTKNPQTGGFYQQVNICPSDLRSLADASKCFPPPDCSLCGGAAG